MERAAHAGVHLKRHHLMIDDVLVYAEHAMVKAIGGGIGLFGRGTALMRTAIGVETPGTLGALRAELRRRRASERAEAAKTADMPRPRIKQPAGEIKIMTCLVDNQS